MSSPAKIGIKCVHPVSKMRTRPGYANHLIKFASPNMVQLKVVSFFEGGRRTHCFDFFPDENKLAMKFSSEIKEVKRFLRSEIPIPGQGASKFCSHPKPKRFSGVN